MKDRDLIDDLRHPRGRLARSALFYLVLAVALVATGCPSSEESGGGESSAESSRSAGGERSAEAGGSERGRRGQGGGRPGGGRGGEEASGPPPDSGVPVEVQTVELGSIASFFATNATLEAENEVDVVARVAGPIVELLVEEGDRVRAGQRIARLDDRELQAQVQSVEVRLEEAKASFERTRSLFDQELVSRDLFDQARAASETAGADAERLRIQLAYTTINAPFAGLVVERYVRFAEYVENGSRLVRLSDFDPLWAPIQIPERHLQRLRVGQKAQLRVEAFGDRSFTAQVLRIRPVVDATSGTIEVTLEVSGEGVLRPGMFSSVELEMERRDDVVIVPKVALTLDSLQPTVFVAEDAGESGKGSAVRRQLEIGLRNDRQLEVISGLAAGERVVVVGQDGLADGIPLEWAGAPTSGGGSPADPAGVVDGTEARGDLRGEGRRGEGPAGGRRGPPDFLRDVDWSDPAQVERVREHLRGRGLSEPEVEQRLERMKERFDGTGSGPGTGG